MSITRDFQTETINALNNELYAIMDANLGLQGLISNRAELEALIPGAGPQIDTIINHYMQLQACVQDVGVAVDEVCSAASKADEEYSRQLRGAKEKAHAMYRFLKVQTHFINPVALPGSTPPLLMNPELFRKQATEWGQQLFITRSIDALRSVLVTEVNGVRVYNWDKLEAILGRPYNAISDLEWWVLGEIYTGMNYTKLPQFLELFACRDNLRIYSDLGRKSFSFDNDKLSRLLWNVEVMAEVNLQLQGELFGVCGVTRLELRNQRNYLLQRSALLTILLGSTGPVSNPGGWDDLQVIIGDSRMPALTLERDSFGTYILSFQDITRLNLEHDFLSYKNDGHRIVQISQGENGGNADDIFRRMAVNHYVSKYEFNLNTHIQSGLVGVATETVISAGVGQIVRGITSSKPILAAAVIAVDVGKIFTGTSGEQARSVSIQNDFRNFGEHWAESDMIKDFALSAVIIDDNRNGVYALTWDSVYTGDRINYLNQAMHPSGNFTPEDFRDNPVPAFDAWDNLSPNQRNAFENRKEYTPRVVH